MKGVAVDERVPPGQVWLINPGESVEAVGPQGSQQVVELKPPQVVKIVGIGECL
jgi:hypothetical protein